MVYWTEACTVGSQIYGAAVMWVCPSYSLSMSVGLAAGAGAGGVTSCAKTTAVAPKKAATNRTTDEAKRFLEVKAFIALDSTGARPERLSQRRKTSARAADCINGTANRSPRRYH